MLFRAAKANAALDGRDHALPDDVQALAALGAQPIGCCSRPARASDEREAVVRDALERVPAL